MAADYRYRVLLWLLENNLDYVCPLPSETIRVDSAATRDKPHVVDKSRRATRKGQDEPRRGVHQAPRKGLVNLGNTCYMNAVLQAMSVIPELTTHLRAVTQASVNTRRRAHNEHLAMQQPQRRAIAASFRPTTLARGIFEELASVEPGVFRPETFVYHVWASSTYGFQRNAQQDVADFFSKLRGDISLSAGEPAEYLFRSIVRNIICHTDLSPDLLPLPNDAIAFDFQIHINAGDLQSGIERMGGEQNVEVTLRDKTKSSTCRRTTKLVSVSPVLVFQLMRFGFSGQGFKITDSFDFPFELSVSTLTDDGHSALYALQSVVVHHGASSTADGHYTSYIRPVKPGTAYSNAPWFWCNDQTVQTVTPEYMMAQTKSNAYLLFYAAVSTLSPA